MTDLIPFIGGEEGCTLARKIHTDSAFIRLPIDRFGKLFSLLPAGPKVWLDPCVDGMDVVGTRRNTLWFDFMKGFPSFEAVADPSFHARPSPSKVLEFVTAVLDRCVAQEPAWITVPQLPLVDGSTRNKINRELATATGKWKSNAGFSGRLILPLVFTRQNQVNRKTERNPKVQQAERCYSESRADGFWVVDKSLDDDSGSRTLSATRFPGLLGLHEEINDRIPSKIRVAGPYWGLNLVLWAKGLVDHPASGIGSGFQYFLAGGHAMQPSPRLALPSLRRRVGFGQLKPWLERATSRLARSHPAHGEFSDLLKSLALLSDATRARYQVAKFYKTWYDLIGSGPAAGRSLALFQDLSIAYALGKSLPDLGRTERARRPEAVAETLMLSCL
jgi:hypothetical protein